MNTFRHHYLATIFNQPRIKMKRILSLLLLVGGIQSAAGQAPSEQKVFTEDIDRFWIAYDSIRTTTDRSRQLAFINNLYIRPGTEGLAAFMEARNYSAELWVDLITKLPKFWASIRPNRYANPEAVECFLKQSGYYPKGWDKAALLTSFAARQPVVVGTMPVTSGNTELDAGTRTLIIQFNQEMGKARLSALGREGRNTFR